MADPKLVEILLQGSEVWNRWREKQPGDFISDLSNANLSGVDLGGSDLSYANLSGADLRDANLWRTYLSYANFNYADLSNVNFIGADLSDVRLIGADLSMAHLNGVDLHRSCLIGANLYGAMCLWTDFKIANLSYADLSYASLDRAIIHGVQLKGTNFRQVRFNQTIFAWTDLSQVKELEIANHTGPSCVDINSVILPYNEQIRLHFLRGVGFTETEIEYLPSLLTTRPIEYQSLFISYAYQDEVIARQIYTDLRKKDVPCWFAPHDMKIGDKIRPSIDEAIHQQDKLLLILSEESVVSDWVEHEVETALARERKEKRTILFPIRLDNAILERDYTGWAALVQHERHIGDFTHWTDPQAYEQAFNRLLRDLKSETKGESNG